MDRNKVKVVFVLGILVCILVACGGEPTSDFNQPLSTPTTLTYPSVSPTITPTRYIATVTSKPDVATRQSWRSTAIAIATLERATQEYDWNAKETQIAQFVLDCNELEFYSTEISPDGTWIAASCGYKKEQKLIVKSRQGVIWELKASDFTIHGHEVSLFPESWSPDSGYLYFSAAIGFDGGGNQCFPEHLYRGSSYGLFQLNLDNGSWATLLPPTRLFSGYGIRFSPTGRRYAVDLNGITIADLKSGDLIQIDTSGVMDLLWSPDGRYLAYSVAKCNESGWVQSASVYAWDSLDNRVQLLVTFEEEKLLLYPESWVDNSTLRVLAEKWVGFDNFYDVYVYDISKGDIIFLGTATPSP